MTIVNSTQRAPISTLASMLNARARRRAPLRVSQIFGLSPARQRIAEAWLALRGEVDLPATRWGLSSVKIFKPWLSIPTWLGRVRDDRRVPIYNFFNRTPTSPEQGWSVRVTQVRDFTGGTLTYDSHNGTDFVVPTGTTVVAPADGRVAMLPNEFNRGGLKVVIDHGHGVVTSSNHLGEALVEVGQLVHRGEPIAYSGYSGLDGFSMFPWLAPHVHFNVFLNGVHVDPFAIPGTDEVSLWLGGRDPVPYTGGLTPTYEPTEWNADGLSRIVAGCRNDALRERLARIDDIDELAAEVLYRTAYYPTRFAEKAPIYTETYARKPLLSLPLSSEDFVGVIY